MTFNKLSSSLTRAAPVLSLLVVAAILFAAPLSTAPQTAATTIITNLSPEQQDVIETQDVATEELTESHRDVNGIEFKPRWGAVAIIEADSQGVLFADCDEDEFAVSNQFVFESSDIITSQSFPIALPDDFMTWVAVVENTHSSDDKAASIGVICASENDDDEDDGDDLDVTTKTTINNVVRQFIKIENNQIVNVKEIVNIRYQIINNAKQIVNITGNNNTVNQVINQSASQLVNQNATEPEEIDLIINQTAQQEGVVIGDANLLNQTIDQEAEQIVEEETITPPPANETIVPEDETIVPEDETIVPEDETIVPANETIVPEDETTTTEDETTTDDTAGF